MAKNSPETSFRLGNVSATVWSNPKNGDDGGTFRTVQVEQRYKDGDDWKSSNRFTLEQLLRLRVCIDKAVAHLSDEEMKD